MDEIVNLIESVSEGFPSYFCQKRDFRNWAISGTGQITVFGKKDKIVACDWGGGINFLCSGFLTFSDL